jgi:hypothetical protein
MAAPLRISGLGLLSDFGFRILSPRTLQTSKNRKFHPSKTKSHLFPGGLFRQITSLRGRRGGLFGLGFSGDFSAFEVSLTAFSLDGFVILLAHNSLQLSGIPIWCATL